MSSVKSVFINAPATSSTNQTNGVLTGNLSIENKNCEKSGESIKVAFSVNKRENKRELKDWLNIINKRQILSKQNSTFVLKKEDWLRNGGTWVIATPVFEKTSVKLTLDASELLEPGFMVQIFTRDALIIREVPADRNLATGVTINFEIGWTAVSNIAAAEPAIEPLRLIS